MYSDLAAAQGFCLLAERRYQRVTYLPTRISAAIRLPSGATSKAGMPADHDQQ
jgi:hypothetical protein